MNEKKRKDSLCVNYHMLGKAKERKKEAIFDGDDYLKNQMTRDISSLEARIMELGGEVPNG